MSKTSFTEFVGLWKYSPPWDDTDDFRSEYEVSGNAENPLVKARDFYDGEEYLITNISFRSGVLQFDSFMKSTGRKGHNKLSISKDGGLDNEFTFTETSKLTKTT